MHKLKYLTIFIILVMLSLSLAGPSLDVSARPVLATTPVGLGTAGNFAVLAGSAVNDTTPSVINGDVGLSPAAWPPAPALTCAEVTGTIYSVDASGPLPCRVTDAGLLTIAKNDLTTAYNDATGRVATTIATELGGVTLTDGTYDSASATFQIVTGGTLTLDGGGSADSVFIFKMGSTLTTFSNSSVVLTNGAQACNVFWQVGSSAVLGTGTTFVGTIMADQSITDDGGSTVDGRFLARSAAVTLNNTTISRPFCGAQITETPTSTPTSGTPTSTATTGTPTATSTGPAPTTTNTPVPPVPTATHLPVVTALPGTGGAPIRNEGFPWSLVILGGFSAIALVLGIQAYRRTSRSKQ